MGAAWKILIEAGVPDGPAHRREGVPKKEPVRAALKAALDDEDMRPGPLLAWLAVFKHHWPARFQAVFGEDGEKTLESLARRPIDRGHYLKLRRIALAHLAENLPG